MVDAADRSALRLPQRGVLQAGLAIGAVALGQRAACVQHQQGQHQHGHRAPDPGLVNTTVAATDQPLRVPEIRRSRNGVLSTSPSCGYAWRDIGGQRLYLRATKAARPVRPSA